ncbi:MAG TPA: NTP transferase domain-containing protein [Rhizomicrobium sp.]|jgi:spore coat polysaccharide biosynthesis protein SpsF|nr:NTP transferase domain-containing protein [Rhizomicrobium sp.]
MTKLRIVAVIQARMGSTRLPGKVLKPIAGQPLLWHIVHRLKASKLIEDIAIATTTNPLDEAIVEFGAANGITVVRGPEDDVLARFAMAAEQLDADVIVRVSSDAPFVDAGFIDHLVSSLIAQDGDYVLMEDGVACAHEGVDPLTRRGLTKLMREAPHDPVAREHVTGYFKLHPDFVPIARAAAYPGLAREAGRLTVDTPDDLVFVEALHQRLHARAGEASLADLLLLLEREPSLRAINGHVKQKQLGPLAKLALIRCDGGGKFGYGHVKRMVALARSLRDQEGVGVAFALHGSEDAAVPMRCAGFETTMVRDHAALLSLIASHKPDMLVLDGREGPSRAEVETLRRARIVTAIVDDASDARLACDFAYYPPVPQTQALDWKDASTIVRTGWEWALLGLNPHLTPVRGPATPCQTLLVAMGGSDPQGLTLRAAHALVPLERNVRVRFVIGSGMENAAGVARTVAALKSNFETIEGTDDLALAYASADLALCAFGVTAYELAAFGVPALYLGLTEDHVRSASAFDDAGMGVSLGLASAVTDKNILGQVKTLLDDPIQRLDMRTAALATLDGSGASRIAADLAQALRETMPRRAAQ